MQTSKNQQYFLIFSYKHIYFIYSRILFINPIQILKDLPEQSSILTTLKYIVDRVINAFKLEIEPVVLSADEESLLEKECSSCSDDLVESKEKLSNLSLSEEENEDDTDSDTGDEFLDDLNWQAEKKPVDDNEGLDSAHVSVLDKLQVTATKSLGHYQRYDKVFDCL